MSHLRGLRTTLVASFVIAAVTATGPMGSEASRALAGTTIELQVAGRAGVPADAAAVALDLTAVAPDGAGFATVWPCGQPRPTASNLNYVAGQIVANLVVTRIGSLGRVCVFTQQSDDVVADVAGYFPAGSSYRPLDNPSRLLDTRTGLGAATTGALGADQTFELQVGGRSGIPVDASVVLDVASVNSAGAGFVTVWPCGQPRPNASNLNVTDGGTVANLVISEIGAGGKVCLYSQRQADLVVDASGWFPAGSGFGALAVPQRVLDTRTGVGGTPGPIPADGVTQLRIGGRAGVPTGSTAVALNVTSVDAASNGFVTVWPCDQPRPTASNLNAAAGQNVANLVITRLDPNGSVCIYTQPSGHLVADVAAYVPDAATYVPLPSPARILDSRACAMVTAAAFPAVTSTSDGPRFDAIAQQSDGRLLVAGRDANGVADVERRLPDGSSDLSFGVGGHTLVPNLVPVRFGATELAIDSAGRVLLSGVDEVVRLTANGTIDTSFSGASGATQMVVQPDGRPILMTLTTSTDPSHPASIGIVRLTDGGSVDPTFSPPSQADLLGRLEIPTANYPAQTDGAVALQPDGKLLVGSGRTLLRLLGDGTVDLTFGSHGVATMGAEIVQVLALTGQGELVVTTNGVQHVLGNGTIDSGYGDHGVAPIAEDFSVSNDIPNSPPSPPTTVHVSALFRNASLIADGGSVEGIVQFPFRTRLGITAFVNRVYRLRPDGSPDASFGIGGKAPLDLPREGGIASDPIPTGAQVLSGDVVATAALGQVIGVAQDPTCASSP